MRPIDADALKEVIYEDVPLKYFNAKNLDKAYQNMQHLLEVVNQRPTIDAVPVVLCKDCKWSKPATNGKGLDGYGCTKNDNPACKAFWWLTPDWFCADGEKKDT